MRQMAMAFVAVAVAGCGEKGLHAWDENHDGLIAQCEGLNRVACGVTPGCQGQELACILICRDDGKGGCLPCDDFQCIPQTQPSCESLTAHQCANDPRCVVSLATSPGACPPNAFCETSAVSVCQTKPPSTPDCALIPVGVCSLVPACEVQDITVCSVEPDHGIGNQKPTAGCFPSCTTTQICAARTTASCEGRPPAACTADPKCELQTGPVCEIACLPGQACPPCATPTQLCVTKPSHCESRSIDQCLPADGCQVEAFACLAICEDDGNGGCLPCDAPPPRCVAMTAQKPEPR